VTFFGVVMLVSTLIAGPSLAAPVVPGAPTNPQKGLVLDPPPEVSAGSWILYDDTYDLVSQDPDTERAMASTTKIMTALVAYQSADLDRAVTISQRAADIGEAEIRLVPGEKLTLGSLVTAMLVRSANDAAIAVAEGVGGSVSAFVAMMNRRAAELGLVHTHFTNPHGLDADGHYTSASDLLAMAREGMKNPDFARAVGSSVYLFFPGPDGKPRPAVTTNKLLETYPGAIGVKTGYTERAGRVLVAAAEREGRRIYAVVMGSHGSEDAHFEDAARLLDYGFGSFGLVPAVIEGRSYGVVRSGEGSTPVLADGTVEVFMHLAAAGLLDPKLGIENGDPVIVADDAHPAVPIKPAGSDPLPGPLEAVGWLWHLMTGEAA
jgi:D-alanyl-D-alanine carboxypeptidase (penicillin-binding protein 5/6)